MLFRIAFLIFLVVIAAGLIAPAGRASLYQPDEPQLVTVGAEGGKELDFERQFKSKLIDLMNERNPNLKSTDGKQTPREKLLARVAERKKLRNRTPADNAALAADLLRLGNVDEAEAAVSRDRQGFLTNMTLAHIHAIKSEWAKASEYLSIANEERPPANMKDLTGPHFEWEQRINRGPLAKLFESRWQESRAKHAPENEDVDPIFGVKFMNEAGKYEPGKLADTERKKLPSDAIAIVQQMVLWSPTDTRLYWQLGELYAANGKFVEAKKILDECVYETRQYSNRKILMDHRAEIKSAAEEQAKQRSDAEAALTGNSDANAVEQPPSPQPAAPFDIGAVWIYFGVVALVVLFGIVRIATRKPRGARALRR